MQKTVNQAIRDLADYITFDQAIERWCKGTSLDESSCRAALLGSIEKRKVGYRRADRPHAGNTIMGYRHHYLDMDETVYELQRHGLLLVERKSFEKWTAHIARQAEEKSEPLREPLSTKEKSTHLNIMGALLDLLLDEEAGGNQRRMRFHSQSQLIDELLDRYSYNRLQGLKQKTLEVKFKEARDHFKSELEESQLR